MVSQKHNWHSLTRQEVAGILGTDLQNGLSEKEAIERQKFGRNEIVKDEGLKGLKIFISQIKSPLIFILLAAGIITLFLKEWTDTIVIFLAVGINIIVGYTQEFKASRILEALQKVVKAKTIVVREGKMKEVEREVVVAGDIIVFKAGDKIPADGRIISGFNLKIQEAALTGEWLSANKYKDVLLEKTPLADRDNMVYLGTIVEEGIGKAVVTEIGEYTELGRIAKLIQETKDEKTPYQKKLARFAKILGVIILSVCFLVFLRGVLNGKDFKEMFLTSVAVAVAAIPEGLAVSLTVVLALGMQRILKEQGLVRQLASAETLGSTSVIATDKTLTLTEGKMELAEIKSENPRLALQNAILTTQAFIEGKEDNIKDGNIKGEPMETAFLKAGITMGLLKSELEEKFPKLDEIPFQSQNKFVCVLRKSQKGNMFFFTGAPEKIIGFCGYIAGKTGKKRLNKKALSELGVSLRDLTSKGLRVVASAYKRTNQKIIDLGKEPPAGLVFAGLLALKDPLRKDVKEAILLCQTAGIKVVIVTGDHILTAKAVAQELGFKTDKENIIEALEIDKYSDGELQKILPKINIFARVEPRHKARIVEAWQKRGEVVAMTGDGINDALALKKADIGVALGSGTDVAKEASDLVLLNDSFSIIVKAVEEGRAILDNIRKVITYLLSDSFTEMILVGVSVIFGFPLPLLAVQILWVNLIEDGLPNIALAFEPKEKDLLRRKPDDKKAPLLNREMKTIIFAIGFFTDIILLGIFFWLYNIYGAGRMDYIRTIIFCALAIDSLFYVFSCKSLRKNIWRTNIFSNKILVFSWAVGFAALILAVYLKPLQSLLKTVPLTFSIWLILISFGILKLFLIESVKYFFNRRV